MGNFCSYFEYEFSRAVDYDALIIPKIFSL
jgi:hypothetical protein